MYLVYQANSPFNSALEYLMESATEVFSMTLILSRKSFCLLADFAIKGRGVHGEGNSSFFFLGPHFLGHALRLVSLTE